MNRIERAYPWILLAPVLLPVVIWGGFIYPYLVPKTLLFYALSFIAVSAFVVLAAYGKAFYWGRLARPESWLPALLLALAYGASLAGIDFYRSFWSLFIRGDGLLMLTCAVGSYYLILLDADRTFFTRLMQAAAGIGSIVALYGIIEWVLGGGRIGSLLGNAAFFAGYLGISFFATLIAAAEVPRGWRRAAYLGAALQVIAVILTATRGTMLAFAAAAVVGLMYVAFMGEGRRRAWSASVLLALTVFGGLFFAFRNQLAHVPFGPVARVASIGMSDPDVASRLFIWKNMVTEIGKSPWLGMGAEHIDVLFNRFYDPTQISEQWFDRSHNAFLDYAAQYGVGGLLLYLSLIASFLTAALRLARRGERRTAGIVALLALVYAVQNFFVFDTISSFWLILALLSAISAYSFSETRLETLPLPRWTRTASLVFALMLIYGVIPASVRPALAAYDLASAYKYQLVDPEKEVGYLSHGVALGTYGDMEYGYEAYDMYANVQAAALTGQARIDAYQAALAILSANFDRYPYDARTALYLAQVLSLVPPGADADGALLSSALERAIRLSPRRSQSWYILANLSISNANAYPPKSAERVAGYAAARDLLTRYIALVPTSSLPHFVLSQLLYASGDVEGAKEEAAKGKQYYTSDLETAKRAASYYENTLDLPNAAFFLAEVVRLDPANAAAKSDLEKIRAYLSR